mgnify:CR=1 FL=1
MAYRVSPAVKMLPLYSDQVSEYQQESNSHPKPQTPNSKPKTLNPEPQTYKYILLIKILMMLKRVRIWLSREYQINRR